MFDLEQLDLESDRDLDKFEEYSRRVYETMSKDSFGWAESLKGSLKNKASSAHPGGYYGVLRSTRVVPVIFRRQISNVARVKYKN